MPFGSYSGDYLGWTDDQLLDLLQQGGGEQPLNHALRRQIVADLRLVIKGRMQGDPTARLQTKNEEKGKKSAVAEHPKKAKRDPVKNRIRQVFREAKHMAADKGGKKAK